MMTRRDAAAGQKSAATEALSALLGSNTRAKLLVYFVLHPSEQFHVRELERRLHEPAGNLLRDLRRFHSIHLLTTQRSGNQVKYALDRNHPLYEDLQRLVLKTAGIGQTLKEALQAIGGVELAFIYGSFAKGEADARSDLDLMVIGTVTDEVLAPAVAEVERQLGRAVSYTRYTRQEARTRARQDGSFLRSVLADPRVILVGTNRDELFRAAR